MKFFMVLFLSQIMLSEAGSLLDYSSSLFGDYHKKMEGKTSVKTGQGWKQIISDVEAIRKMEQGTFEKTILFEQRKKKAISVLENKIKTASNKSDENYQAGIVEMISYDPDEEVLKLSISWQENVIFLVKHIKDNTKGMLKIPPGEAETAFGKGETHPIFIIAIWGDEYLELEDAFILKSKRVYFESKLEKKHLISQSQKKILQYKVVKVKNWDVLNIREYPTWKSKKIGEIPAKGTDVYYLGEKTKIEKSEWFYVQYKNKKGWVNSAYLLKIPQYKVVKVKNWDVLNIRERPTWKSKKVGEIPANGTNVHYLGEKVKIGKSEWFYIQYKNKKGWVNSTYLQQQ